MRSYRLLFAAVLLLLSCRATEAQNVVIDLRRPEALKDLSRCALGAGEEFTHGGIEYADLLGPRRAEFAQAMREAGVRLFRFATLAHYDFAGAEATARLMQAAGHPQPLYRWFDPELLFSFCKENGIRVIAMVNLPYFYDTQSERVLEAARHPQACARNAARFVSWVKEKGFADQVVAWELGGEIADAWCEPEVWAQVSVACARAMKAADPSIKVAVPGFATSGLWAAAPTEEGSRYVEWTTFSREGLAATGRDARLFDSLALHLYGWGDTYHANGIGPENFRRDLIRPNGNLKHLRFIVTAWRFTREPDPGDQTFFWSALQHGKVAADLLADPQIEWIGGIRALHRGGGLVYVSDGKEWHLGAPGQDPIADPLAKPRLALGPHAVVMRWLNEAIAACPRLAGTGDTTGRFSSTQLLQEGNRVTPGLQWLAAVDEKITRLHLLLFSTHTRPELVDLRVPAGWKNPQVVTAETYVADDPFARFRVDGGPQPWRTEAIPGVNPVAGALQVPLPAFSVTRLVVQDGPTGAPTP